MVPDRVAVVVKSPLKLFLAETQVRSSLRTLLCTFSEHNADKVKARLCTDRRIKIKSRCDPLANVRLDERLVGKECTYSFGINNRSRLLHRLRSPLVALLDVETRFVRYLFEESKHRSRFIGRFECLFFFMLSLGLEEPCFV